MAKSVVFRVDLLGASFSITVDSDLAYMQAIFQRYRTLIENTRASMGVDDPLKLAILSGLLLEDEVEKLRSYSKSDEAALESIETEERLAGLIEKIDKVLPPTDKPSGKAKRDKEI